MKTTLLSILVFAGMSAAYSQCNPSISGSANPVTTNMNTLGAGEYWLCENLLATVNSTTTTVYMEDNSSLNCYGCTGTIYAKAGTTVNIYSNGTPTVHSVSGATVFDVSGMATVNSCPSITFDYSNAPAGGCVAGVGIEEYQSNIIQLYPNPSEGNLTVVLANDLNQSYDISVLSIDGSLLKTFSSSTQQMNLDLTDLPTGYYILKLQSEDENVLSRETFVIR